MTILSLEFSSERRSVALARDGIILSEAVQQTGGRTTDALGLIQQVLTESGVAREAIEVIAVGLGPGSYTGIRAAIAVAQGWQLARGVKLLGVSSAEIIATQAQAEKIYDRVNVVIDAQRGEFYLAACEISASEWKITTPLKIATQIEIESLKSSGEICVGPAAERIVFPGAAMAARLAARKTNYLSGQMLEPIYLREINFVKAPAAR